MNNTTHEKIFGDKMKDTWAMQKDIRYDKIFAEMGCHTELVTEPQQIKPALERAFKSGKTSVLNVIPDDRIPPPQQIARIEYYKKIFAGKGEVSI